MNTKIYHSGFTENRLKHRCHSELLKVVPDRRARILERLLFVIQEMLLRHSRGDFVRYTIALNDSLRIDRFGPMRVMTMFSTPRRGVKPVLRFGFCLRLVNP